MHYGIQAAVLALDVMETGVDSDSSNEKQLQAAQYLQQLREHLEAISTPVRRVNQLKSSLCM
jgi:hypothetical protein